MALVCQYSKPGHTVEQVSEIRFILLFRERFRFLHFYLNMTVINPLFQWQKKIRFKLAHLNTPEESLPQNRFGGVMENTAYMSGASGRGLRPGCAGEPEAPWGVPPCPTIPEQGARTAAQCFHIHHLPTKRCLPSQTPTAAQPGDAGQGAACSTAASKADGTTPQAADLLTAPAPC